MVFDVFPFFNELDVLEIRLHELNPVVDKFIILESRETYGGQPKDLVLARAVQQGRFAKFRNKMCIYVVDKLQPACTDRVTGREREAFQRNVMGEWLRAMNPEDDDVVIFSDCDEIPSANAVNAYIEKGRPGIYRFKQRSFYYTVNNLVDYGHDFASRARIGRYCDVQRVGGRLYDFRMALKNTEEFVIEHGGWHFGYFNGGLDGIKNKVSALAPFLAEYKLFGDQQLLRDILDGKDLHHRRCEMPETFWRTSETDPELPAHFLANPEKFAHFTNAWYDEHFGSILPERTRR